MPEISRFYGIIIKNVFRRSSAPHFHAIYGEHEAFVEIETGRILFGYIPGTALRLVQLWTDQHRNELRELWEAAT
jgi:Domain of unknown function (DUF4160)